LQNEQELSLSSSSVSLGSTSPPPSLDAVRDSINRVAKHGGKQLRLKGVKNF